MKDISITQEQKSIFYIFSLFFLRALIFLMFLAYILQIDCCLRLWGFINNIVSSWHIRVLMIIYIIIISKTVELFLGFIEIILSY